MVRDPIAWLYGLQHFGIKLGLENIRSLLAVMGNPEFAYPSVLVAGTNGKGSVAAMLESMLRAHRIRTGLFSSPHLVRPNERIRLDGEDIPTSGLNRHLNRIREIIEDGLGRGALANHPSFFEVITATALQSFKEAAVECAVLEVGMGGRLDATNAVEASLCVVVTVDYDHTDTLGPTLERIAAEKAAIVKRGRRLVSGVEQQEARGALLESCRLAGAPLLEARRLACLERQEEGRFRLVTDARSYPNLSFPLPGLHQHENARVALVALEALSRELGFEPDARRVREGLASVRWPGRLQWIHEDPPLLLDGAHNPAGARALAEYLRSEVDRRGVLLFGAMRRKAVEVILGPLAGQVDAVVITRPPVERAADPEDLAPIARAVVERVDVVREPAEALVRARSLARPKSFVLVTGSLYLVGEVLGLLEGDQVPGPVSM